jgi:hypothetical protein
MSNLSKVRFLLICIAGPLLVLPQAWAEIHIQCARTRCKLPLRDYHKDDTILSATVVSPLTAEITVDAVLPIEVAATIPPENSLNSPIESQAETDRQNDIIRLRRIIRDLGDDPKQAPARLDAELLLARYLSQKPAPNLGVRIAPGTGPKLVTSDRLDVIPTATATRSCDARARAIDCRIAASERNLPVATEVYRTAPAPAATEFVRRGVKSKTFRIGIAVRLANGVIFDQAVLTIYETGLASVNGLVLHDGGPNQALLGSEVTIRIRALGDSKRAELAPADGPVFWETSKTLRIARGKTERLKLTSALSEDIRLHFSEIERMEVNLESPFSR